MKNGVVLFVAKRLRALSANKSWPAERDRDAGHDGNGKNRKIERKSRKGTKDWRVLGER